MHKSGGQVAVVTGAGRGIGREVAGRLAQLGWDVGLTARSASELAVTADLVRSAGVRDLTCAGDVSQPDHVEAFCAAVEQELGPVGALVNNAGVVGQYAPIVASEPEEWWRVLEINTRAPYLFCRRLAPSMIAMGRGYIININSLDCGGSTAAGSPAYSVSKTALRRLTEILAIELDGTGVITVDLSPGLVRTVMGASRPDADEIAPEAWMSPSIAADKVEALLSGRYDRLHGHFLHARDDLDAVAAAVDGQPEARMLRLVPAGRDDPVVLAYAATTRHRPVR
jgi:NAD(P)-dependent dehydrogenase (short-subunit alcohol dehydrogenase family)